MEESTRNLAEVVEQYLLVCKVEGKSPNTVRAYRETLDMFLSIAQEEVFPDDVREITPVHIYTYLGRIMERGVSLETRHRRHREVRFLFSWLLRMGYIDSHPFAHIKNLRLSQKIIQPFSEGDITKLLNASFLTPYLAARNRAIILLLLDTGIRLNELVSLNIEDLDREHQRLRILQGKGNKQRVVRIGSQALAAVSHYVDEYRGHEPGRLFASDEGNPMSRNSVRVMLARLGQRSGVPKVHPHRFRHTFATWAIEHEAREIDVQYLLGHSTPCMVRRYSATYNSEKAARAHERWSPVDMMAGSVPR